MKTKLLLTLIILINTLLFAQPALEPGQIIRSYYTTDLFACRGEVKQNPTGPHFTLGATYDLNEVLPQNFRNLPGKGSGTFSNIDFISGPTARSSKVQINYTLSNEDLFKDSVVIVLDWRRVGTNNTATLQFIIRYQGPFVYAGKDLYKCNTDEIELNSSYYSQGTSSLLMWSSVSTQTIFASQGSLEPAVYTPNQIDITNGYADLILMSDESKITCPNDSDTLRVYFNLNATIEIGDTIIDNFDDERVLLTAIPDGELVYIWLAANNTTVLSNEREYLAYVGETIRLEVNSENCSQTIDLNDLITSTTIPNQAEVFEIYPNPVQDKIRLNTTYDWSIFSIEGKQIINGVGQEIQVSSLTTGVYTLLIKSNNQVINKRFVKN